LCGQGPGQPVSTGHHTPGYCQVTHQAPGTRHQAPGSAQLPLTVRAHPLTHHAPHSSHTWAAAPGPPAGTSPPAPAPTFLSLIGSMPWLISSTTLKGVTVTSCSAMRYKMVDTLRSPPDWRLAVSCCRGSLSRNFTLQGWSAVGEVVEDGLAGGCGCTGGCCRHVEGVWVAVAGRLVLATVVRRFRCCVQ
jgi:hypothetical protein